MSKTDGITYDENIKLIINDNMLNIDNDGYFFYEYIFKINCDAIDNIKFISSSNLNINLTYYIDDQIYKTNEINEFLYICALFSRFKMLIFYE